MNTTKFDSITLPYKQDLFSNLKKMVAINSVYDEDTVDDENPFGKGVSNALKFIESLARQDGFEVTNYKNMIVEIIAGKGDKNITIMAHADIVPAASGWEHDPFDMIEKDGMFFGRGVADDKGPLLASYYGLKALRDNNLLGDYKVRLLVGGNEESGSRGMIYYFEELKKEQPTYGFSPDSSYPLIYGEKEIIFFTIEIPFKSEVIKTFHGGVASNSVIEECVFEINDENFDPAGLDCKKEGNKITFRGKAAHGAIPWEGENAAIKGFKQLGEYYSIDEFKRIVSLIEDQRGEGMNANFTSKAMGTSSCNTGIVDYDGEKITLYMNFRYVETVSNDKVMATIKEACHPYKVNLLAVSPLLFYPVDSVLVSTLLNVYREETGDYETAPQTTGGGTYAKEAKNVIAFGMEPYGFDAKMHSPGERCPIDILVKSMSIYAHAIIELGKKAVNEN